MRARLASLALAAAIVLTAARAAPAKDEEKPKYQRDASSLLMPIVYGVVGLVGTCVVGFKKSKRTHLD
jgi:hypothetical protein